MVSALSAAGRDAFLLTNSPILLASLDEKFSALTYTYLSPLTSWVRSLLLLR
jgi:hypothetical protein